MAFLEIVDPKSVSYDPFVWGMQLPRETDETELTSCRKAKGTKLEVLMGMHVFGWSVPFDHCNLLPTTLPSIVTAWEKKNKYSVEGHEIWNVM